MSYLIKFIFSILIILTNISFANDTKILFEINEKIYSTVDLKNRIKYLEILNSEIINSKNRTDIINDFFGSIIFFEYVKKNNFLNNILENENEMLFEDIIKNKNNITNLLPEDSIRKNINYDFSRKIVLENILDNYKEYIFSNPLDISFIYSHIAKYITVSKENISMNDEFKNILNSQNFKDLNIYLNDKNIDYHVEEIEIKDLNKVNKKIKNLINFNDKFIFEKSSDFYRIINVEKKLDITDGVYYRLINVEFDNKLTNNQKKCNYINSLSNIKSSKEYEFNKLNNKIKNNLIFINDFLIFKNENKFNYIFLCEIRVNEDFLREININKKINLTVRNIELDFINKYSKLYNTKKYYE